MPYVMCRLCGTRSYVTSGDVGRARCPVCLDDAPPPRPADDLAGDDLGELHRRHADRLRAYAVRMLGACDPWVDDVVQDAFVRAHLSGIAAAETPDRVLRWLYVVVRNRCVDVLRARRRDVPVDTSLACTVDVHEVVARNAELAALTASVAALGERQRRALVLCAIDGRTHDEIAVQINASVPAVKSLVCRARAELVRRRAAA